MKIAACSPSIIEYDIAHNLSEIIRYVDEVVALGILIIDKIKQKAASSSIWIALGFIEIDEISGMLYDSAILIDDIGEIALHYRRTSPGWLWKKSVPMYGYGQHFPTVSTPWGKTGFLICGDLFQTEDAAIDAKLDLLLFPFARCHFLLDVRNEDSEWRRSHWSEYAEQIKKINALTIMSNYIAPGEGSEFEGGCGGAFITDKESNILAKLQLNTPGMAIFEPSV